MKIKGQLLPSSSTAPPFFINSSSLLHQQLLPSSSTAPPFFINSSSLLHQQLLPSSSTAPPFFINSSSLLHQRREELLEGAEDTKNFQSACLNPGADFIWKAHF